MPDSSSEMLNSKILILVEGKDDVSFLTGFLKAKGLSEFIKPSESDLISDDIYVQEQGSISSIPPKLDTLLEVLKAKIDEILATKEANYADWTNEEKEAASKKLITNYVIVLVDSSNKEDEKQIQKIKKTLQKFKFPCPNENDITQEKSSLVQFGLYVLKDEENNYNDLESIAIHTLRKNIKIKKNKQAIEINSFNVKVEKVLENFRSTSEQQTLDISHKQSKRELAVCLATFPKYKSNPRYIMEDCFTDYFNIQHPAFTPLNKLLDDLNEKYQLFDDKVDNTPNAQD